jgi:hypothetical protein
MWPAIITLGKFQLTYFGIAMFLGLFVFSFTTWRRMRLDHEEEGILGWTTLTVIGVTLVGWFTYWLMYRKPGFLITGGVLAELYLLLRWSRRQKWDFWEWLDWVGWWMLCLGGVGFAAFGQKFWIYAAAYFLGLLIVSLIEKNYRKIRWYLSGKPGFAGIAAIMWICVVEIVMPMFGFDSLFLAGVSVRQWFAAWLLTAGAVVLYLRSGRKFSKILNKHGK